MEPVPCFNFGMGKKGHGRPSETEVEAIARRLREARAAMGIDQVELCQRTGIGKTTYNNWEREQGGPSRLQARKLKKHLGWTLDYIFEGDPSGMPGYISSKLPKTG